MSTWADVERIALGLPESTLGEAHEGSPAVLVRTRQFARLRWDDTGAEVLQFWVPDAGLVAAYVDADPATSYGAPGFSTKVVMARLTHLENQPLREALVESWMCRAPKTLSKAHADLR
jgi:hypothetical protein